MNDYVMEEDMIKDIADLQQENQQLREENQELKEKYLNAVADYEQEKAKNSKAIEYVTSKEYFFLNNEKTGSFYEDTNNRKKAYNNLLAILKGDSNE